MNSPPNFAHTLPVESHSPVGSSASSEKPVPVGSPPLPGRPLSFESRLAVGRQRQLDTQQQADLHAGIPDIGALADIGALDIGALDIGARSEGNHDRYAKADVGNRACGRKASPTSVPPSIHGAS